MLRFKSFATPLTEAKISSSKFSAAVEIFKRLLERKLNTKMYRYGGAKGYAAFGKYTSILYFYGRGQAISFDYKGGEIETISLWKKYKLGKPGDFVIDIKGLNLVGSAYKLLEIIKSPKMGNHRVNPEIVESVDSGEEVLTEAKRVKPEEFFQLVQSNYSGDMRRVPWDAFAQIADQNNVSVPSFVRYDCKAGKGIYDLTKIMAADEKKLAAAPKKDVDYFIKVTPYDRESRRFLSAKEDKYAGQLLGQINNAIEKPDFKAEMKDPATLFGHMASLVKVLARGKIKSILIYGGPGIGKTFVVNQSLREEGLSPGNGYYVVKGKITTASLYQTLYLHRKGDLLVFDDTDSVWGDQEAANVLKAALDSYDTRSISWYSARTVNISKLNPADRQEFYDSLDKKLEADPTDSKIKFPSEFEYNGKICFISNLPYEKFDEAVLNRSVKIDMTLTQEQIFHRMTTILQHMGDKSVPMDAKEEILDFVKGSVSSGAMKTASMRTYVAAENLYLSGLPNWKELLEYV